MPRYVNLNDSIEELPVTKLLAHMRCLQLMGAHNMPAVTVSQLLATQVAFSSAMFGPLSARGVDGVIAHVEKDLEEIRSNPADLNEWCDLIILAMDGALRCAAGNAPGVNHSELVRAALFNKLARNMQREWPDYRDVPVGQAIEHVRSEASAARKADELAVDGRPVLPGGDTPLELRRFSAKDSGGRVNTELHLPTIAPKLRDQLIRLEVGQVWSDGRERWERTADAPSTGDAYTTDIPLAERRFDLKVQGNKPLINLPHCSPLARESERESMATLKLGERCALGRGQLGHWVRVK